MSTAVVSKSELEEVVEDGTLPLPVAERYLSIYLGDADWHHVIMDVVLPQVRRNHKGDDLGSTMRQIISCAILLPAFEKGQHDKEDPTQLLIKCRYYHQFGERDWFALLQDVIAQDICIERWRSEALSLGVIDKIPYAPIPRQAFNWLYGKAEESEVVTESSAEDIKRRMKNLVYAYGGAVVCNVFMKHKDKVDKIVNWRSGYFFERLIFNIYDIDQVVAIKKAELNKTNSSLIKRIRID